MSWWWNNEGYYFIGACTHYSCIVYLGIPFYTQGHLFRVDNMPLVTIIKKRTSKSKSLMKLLHPLVLCTLRNNMQFKAVHIEGSINMRADALSRFQMSPVREVASNADQHHAETPIEFLNIISSLKYFFLG